MTEDFVHSHVNTRSIFTGYALKHSFVVKSVLFTISVVVHWEIKWPMISLDSEKAAEKVLPNFNDRFV